MSADLLSLTILGNTFGPWATLAIFAGTMGFSVLVGKLLISFVMGWLWRHGAFSAGIGIASLAAEVFVEGGVVGAIRMGLRAIGVAP